MYKNKYILYFRKTRNDINISEGEERRKMAKSPLKKALSKHKIFHQNS